MSARSSTRTPNKTGEVENQTFLRLSGQVWICRLIADYAGALDSIFETRSSGELFRFLSPNFDLSVANISALLRSNKSLSESCAGKSIRSLSQLMTEAELDHEDFGQSYRRFLRAAPRAAEKAFDSMRMSAQKTLAEMTCPLVRNIDAFAEAMGLDAIGKQLTLFLCASRHDPALRAILRSFNEMTNDAAARFLGIALEIDAATVEKLLSPNGQLFRMGIVQFDRRPRDMEDKLEGPLELTTALLRPFESIEKLLAGFLDPLDVAKLEPEDFLHMTEQFELAQRIVRNAIARKEKGVNILLYGPPGSGKTEFSRLLAKVIDAAAFEVPPGDSGGEGESKGGAERFRQYQMRQSLLRYRGDCMMVLDEAEDIFPDSGQGMMARLFGGESGPSAVATKAGVNEVLEWNQVPTVWISNKIHQIDPAFLRRFSLHLEFELPPTSARRRIAERCLGNLPLKPETITAIVEQEEISPAQISAATRAVRLADAAQNGNADETMLRVLKGSLAAAGVISDMKHRPGIGECELRFLNIESRVPIEKVLSILSPDRPTTMLFHGVPGTGKTSLAEMISRRIDRPLLNYRMSDLQSKYVGETEKNIAKMFRRASSDRAVLLLDEADSLLRDRTKARSSWEVTQVNELLQQMERFSGVFVCATNLMDDLDDAAMRRFTFKLNFVPLRVDQRMALFERDSGFSLGAFPEIARALAGLDELTVGDFATVVRQSQLFGERFSPDDLLARLQEECAHKRSATGKRRAIGFLS